MTAPRLQWLPDVESARILAAYARRRESWRSVLRRGLRMVAIADGVVDSRGRVVRGEGRQP